MVTSGRAACSITPVQSSPMKIDWQHQWMSIPYQGSSNTLFGQFAALPDESTLQLALLDEVPEQSSEPAIPLELEHLLHTYQQLFAVPVGLPHRRFCDRSIPLIPRATPVAVRPYRFAPALKDEIERQIKDMLSNGLIRPSTNPFSSAVLLVKKKDSSWRFCVVYRHLNAITAKSKYPVPNID
ncbi:hypothetical protein U9M48_009623 [Paspalum notatum var. saurae]|uniref:Uncharacterized protein n=1 Tax=Paspalum notatum var. saurae TaxID=547442 RepID=A0AAQ3SRZ4_PASNO